MIKAKVISDSLGIHGDRITTLEVTAPRYILAEFNTHRAFTRNSASSRAIPFQKMVQAVKENPFIPIAYQMEHKGMQGTEYFPDYQKPSIDAYWLSGRDLVIHAAEGLSMYGVTKQLANRFLEPVMYHTILVTATEWENFFNLRCPRYVIFNHNDYDERLESETYRSRKDAIEVWRRGHIHEGNLPLRKRGCSISELTETDWLTLNKGQADIHMMATAEAIWDAMNESTPIQLSEGEWHLPYKQEILKQFGYEVVSTPVDVFPEVPLATLVSSVMCARVSYTVPNHDLTEWTLSKYVTKAMDLIKADPLHASPFEHINYCMGKKEYSMWLRTRPAKEDGTDKINNVKSWFLPWNNFEGLVLAEAGWCRNIRGFRQLRDIIEAEAGY